MTLVGGLDISKQSSFGNLAYPGQILPADLPLKPYLVPGANGQVASTPPPVNPYLQEAGGGYVITICNTSSASHTVQRVDARILAVTPTAGTTNDMPLCVGQPYSRQYGAGNGGCGGADFENEYMHAPFSASAGVGATVTVTQKGTNCCSEVGPSNYGPLPVTLRPGQGMTIEVGMGGADPTHTFAVSGMYTFSFGLGVDGAAPVFATTSPQTLLTANVRTWTGSNCTAAAMQSQIPPATTPPSYYLCPAS